jgi:hypothetical protein
MDVAGAAKEIKDAKANHPPTSTVKGIANGGGPKSGVSGGAGTSQKPTTGQLAIEAEVARPPPGKKPGKLSASDVDKLPPWEMARWTRKNPLFVGQWRAVGALWESTPRVDMVSCKHTLLPFTRGRHTLVQALAVACVSCSHSSGRGVVRLLLHSRQVLMDNSNTSSMISAISIVLYYYNFYYYSLRSDWSDVDTHKTSAVDNLLAAIGSLARGAGSGVPSRKKHHFGSP